MTPQTELRLINKVTNNKPFMKASRLSHILGVAKATISNRRSAQTDLELEHEIRMCEIRKCLPLLKKI